VKHLSCKSISTGSLSLDIALGIGGVPQGRIIEIYGPESTGKRGGVCSFIDIEHALDPSYAAKIGVDVAELYVSQPDTGE